MCHIRQTGDKRRDQVAPIFDLGLKNGMESKDRTCMNLKKKEDIPPPLKNVTCYFFSNNIYIQVPENRPHTFKQ